MALGIINAVGSAELYWPQGIPYVINQFRVVADDGSFQDRKLEFPLGSSRIELSQVQT